jgi:acetyl esterase/lipase
MRMLRRALLACAVFAGAQAGEPPARPFDPGTIPAARTLRDLAYGPHARHRLDLDFPERAGPGPLPVVLWVHGGAWRMGDKRGGSARRLLPHGYAVASINYRYATEAPFPAQIEDGQRAVRWLRAHAAAQGLDAERIGAWGGSAGGHLVALLGTAPEVFPPAPDDPHAHLPAGVRAVCAINPVTDFARWDAQMLPGAEHPADWYAAPLLGGSIAARPALARLASPLFHVTARAAAFFIVHGDGDRVVPPRQAVSLHEALRAAGAASTLHLIPGADHGGPAFSAGMPHAEIVAFFDRHLIGAHEKK